MSELVRNCHEANVITVESDLEKLRVKHCFLVSVNGSGIRER